MAADDKKDNLEDLGDLLLPNSSYSISWNELELDSDGEVRLVGDFERNPVSPTLILNNNGALDSDGEIRLVSDFDRNPVSPTLILNDYGGDGKGEENAREEVKGGKFPPELSKKFRESNHQSLDVLRQQWQNFPRVIPNFPDLPSSGSKLALDSDGEIWSVDAFERKPVSPTLILKYNGGDGTVDEKSGEEKVSPTFILTNNGGDGTVQEITWEEEVKERKFPLGISKKVCKSSHRHFGGRRQQWQNFPWIVPNFPDSPSSGSKLDLDSDGEIWSVDAFEGKPVSPTLILNYNGGDGTVEEKSQGEKVSPTFILNNNGGDGTVQENTREEKVKERKFPLDISNKGCKSSHRHFGGRRQQWQNFPRIVPNFPDSPNSGSKLALDSDGEIWSLDDFKRNPVSPTLILNNNCGYGTVEENSWEEKVSPTLILNNNGGDGTVQEKTREEVKGRNFPLGVSKKVCKSSHPNFGCRRQKWRNSLWVSPNSSVSPLSWSESMSDLGSEIWLSDDFDRNPVSTTFFLNDNGGNGTVEENTREDEAKGRNHPPDFSEKAPKSNHWSLACRKTEKTSARRCMHCQAEKTPQWRAGPMGPKTLCNACGVRYKSGRLLPQYRPAASPTFDSLKHSNFHRKIARNLIRNQVLML